MAKYAENSLIVVSLMDFGSVVEAFKWNIALLRFFLVDPLTPLAISAEFNRGL